VWKIWGICDRHSRPLGFSSVGSIDVRAAIDLCDAYGAFLEDFERVLLIEDIIYPRMQEKMKKDSSKQPKQTIH